MLITSKEEGMPYSNGSTARNILEKSIEAILPDTGGRYPGTEIFEE